LIFKRCTSLAVLLLWASLTQLPAQERDSLARTSENPWYLQRKNITTAVIATHTLFTTYLEYKWWWEGNYHPFKYENDGFWHNYSLGVDKVGHFYTSYCYTNALSEILQWSGYSRSTATWWASGIAFFYALSIEIGDGFSTYAFSLTDLTANTLGIGYAYLQQRVPFFQNFKFKWSYYPSGKIPMDEYFRLTDDYDGHIYWLSVDVYNLLPAKAKHFWIPYLNIAFGYGGENIYGRPTWVSKDPIYPTEPAKRKFVVALDYNLSAIPTTHETWTTVKRLLDLFHYPAPAVSKTQGKPAKFKPLLLN